MIFRNFEHRDSKKVVEFHEQVLKETGAFAPGPWNDDMLNIEDVYLKPGGAFIIVEDHASVIGMGALRIISAEEAEVKRMRVRKELQRKGIGQKILDHLLNHANNMGIKRVILDTTELQEPAQQLYLRNGFREYGQDRWHGLTVKRYEKILVKSDTA